MPPAWPPTQNSALRSPHPSVSVRREDFDLTAEVSVLRQGQPQVGAVCSFVGTVRDDLALQRLLSLEIEHYPGMTERAIEAMIGQAQERFGNLAVRVVHRVGVLTPGEQIVLVAVASAHRAQAFAACEFLMDYLKTQAPFWKKETTSTGARWVEARVADDEALARWGIEARNAAI